MRLLLPHLPHACEELWFAIPVCVAHGILHAIVHVARTSSKAGWKDY